MMFGLALGQSFSHQMQSMVRNESFTRQLNVLRGKPLFFRSARTSCTTSGGPVRPQETQTFLCRPFRPKSAITMWAIKHCLVERGVNSCPDDLEHFYIKKKNSILQRSTPGCPSEVEFVHTVTAGSSVKFLPAS